MLIDLHTHSHCSDGALSPADLVRRAADRHVGLMALTDHDTVAGIAEAQAVAQTVGVHVLPSVEVSSLWREQSLHVVGLGVDPANEALTHMLTRLRLARRERLAAMAERVERNGVVGFVQLAQERFVGDAAFGRVHLAQLLVELGRVPHAQAAFKLWLGKGAKAYVCSPSVALDEAVATLRAAGGVACLAHPARYVQSNGQLRKLLATFSASGGEAMEVSTSGDNGQTVARLADLAKDFKLQASVGSDFHMPGLPWRELGRYLPLPAHCDPVAERWLRAIC